MCSLECVIIGGRFLVSGSRRTRSGWPRPLVSTSVNMLAHTLLLALVLARAAADGDEDCPATRNPVLHDEVKLHKDLFCAETFGENFRDYRPVMDHRSTVNVKVRFAIKYINFENGEETFTLHSWVALMWKDEYMVWDPDHYGGIKEIQVESTELWTPRMALFNADASMGGYDELYTTCLIDSNGTVTCVPHLTHSGICRSSLRRWPYDEQNCTLYFGSWMHTGEQVNFTFYAQRPVITDDYQDGPGWHLEEVQHERLPGVYASMPNTTYPMLKYTFRMRRVAAGPAALVVVPSVVVVCLTLLAMYLGVRDNVRLLLACFSLYGHFMFLQEIGESIPKHSADTPILLLFVRDSMVVTLVGIAETLVLMHLVSRVGPAPAWVARIVRLVHAGPARYAVFTEFDPSDTKILPDDPAASSEEQSHATEWIQFASIINSLCFIGAALTYFILVLTYIPFGA